MAAITETQLENAALDAQTLEYVVNGSVDETVITRLGRTLKSLASYATTATPAELAAYIAQAELLIASIGIQPIPFQTKALMDADLDHNAGVFALVTDDGANSGLYDKIGASGAGNWHKAIDRVDIETAARVAAETADTRLSLFPDPTFRILRTTSQKFYTKYLIGQSYSWPTWNGAYKNDYSDGAWESTVSSAFMLWFDWVGVAEYLLTTGDVYSVGLIVSVETGTTGRFLVRPVKDTDQNFVGSNSYFDVVGDGTVKLLQFNGLSLPATANGLALHWANASGSGTKRIFAFWVVKNATAGAAPPKNTLRNATAGWIAGKANATTMTKARILGRSSDAAGVIRATSDTTPVEYWVCRSSYAPVWTPATELDL